MKYICSEYNDKLYLRGLCCNGEDYSNWVTIETDFNAKNKYLNEEGRPIWKVEKGKVVYEPLEKSAEELEAEKIAKEKEDYIKALPDLVKVLQEEIVLLKSNVEQLKEVTKK